MSLLDSLEFLVLVAINKFTKLIVFISENIIDNNTAAKFNILKTNKSESFLDRLLKAYLFLI